MILEVLIHPSRLELVNRIVSDEGEGFTTKKLSSADMSYKFGILSVEQGENFNLFKKDLEKLLAPYINDAGTIYIVPPSFFFQTKSFSCSPENALFNEYIQWEASCMATDVLIHYRFGHYYCEKSGKMSISLVRKAVADYFKDILNEIYSGKIDFRLISQVGYDDDDSSCIQIEVGNELTQPFSAEEAFSPVSLEDTPVDKKKNFPYAAAILLIAVLISAFILLKTGLFTGTDAHVSELTVTDPVSTEVSIVETEDPFYSDEVDDEIIEETDIAEEFTADDISEIDETPHEPELAEISITVVTPPEPERRIQTEEPVSPVSAFWDLNLQLLNYGAEGLSFSNGQLSMLIDDNNVNRIKQNFADSGYEFFAENGTLVISHTSFDLDNYSDAQNKNSFYKVRDENYLFFSDNTYTSYVVASERDLTSLFRGFKQNLIEFKQFKVDRSGERILFTPVLD